MDGYNKAYLALLDVISYFTERLMARFDREFWELFSGVLGIVVGIICYIAVCVGVKNKKKRFIERAKEKKNFTTAYYVKHMNVAGRRDSGTSDQYRRAYVTYEYHVKGKRYKKKYCYNADGNMTPVYPNSFTIYYSGRNPRKVMSEDESIDSRYTLGCFTSVIAMAIIINLCRVCINAVFGVG